MKFYPSKHFNLVSTFLLGRYNVKRQINIETKLCMYVSVEIYNVEQRRINIVYFNVDISNVRKRQHNVFIFNVKFHKVDQSRNNVMNMTIWKSWTEQRMFLNFKKKKKYKKNKTIISKPWHYSPILIEIWRRIFANSRKFL